MEWPPVDILDFYASEEFHQTVGNVCARLASTFIGHRQVVSDVVFDTSTDLLLKLLEENIRGTSALSSFPTRRHFEAYLEKRCRWRILDRLREESRRDTLPFDEEWQATYPLISGAALDPFEHAAHREVLEQLPPAVREVVEAYLLTGSADAAATALGISLRTVQRDLRHAREIFANLYRP